MPTDLFNLTGKTDADSGKFLTFFMSMPIGLREYEKVTCKLCLVSLKTGRKDYIGSLPAGATHAIFILPLKLFNIRYFYLKQILGAWPNALAHSRCQSLIRHTEQEMHNTINGRVVITVFLNPCLGLHYLTIGNSAGYKADLTLLSKYRLPSSPP